MEGGHTTRGESEGLKNGGWISACVQEPRRGLSYALSSGHLALTSRNLPLLPLTSRNFSLLPLTSRLHLELAVQRPSVGVVQIS